MLVLNDNTRRRRVPLATHALVGLNAAVFLMQLGLSDAHLEAFFYEYGLVPLRYSRPDWAMAVGLTPMSPWPFLTALFLHGGWLHIIGNMWMLWVFGRSLEERMGAARFLGFYLLGGMGAMMAQFLTHVTSPAPIVGASGAIAAVLAGYLVLYPLSWLTCVVPIFIFPIFLRLPAFLFILFWFWMQLFSGTLALVGPTHGGGVAWWAHIGGFVLGLFLLRWFLPPKKPHRETPPPPVWAPPRRTVQASPWRY